MTAEEAMDLLDEYENKVNALKVKKEYFTTHVGDVIKFGEYEWFVIAKRADGVTLLCKDIICLKPYDEQKPLKSTTWDACSLRKWLNDDFYKSFSNEDRRRIVQTKNINKDTCFDGDRIYNVIGDDDKILYTAHLDNFSKGGDDTYDFIYLLSLDEVKPLPVDIRKASDDWWLRSPGYYQIFAAYIGIEGAPRSRGCKVIDEIGVRPALNLKFKFA